jgi:hypothetical protein
MQARADSTQINFLFSLYESRLLRRVFNQLSRDYEFKPDQTDPALAKVWYSTQGCKTGQMDEEATKEFLQTLHSYKSALSAKLKQWAEGLARGKENAYPLTLKLDDAPDLLTALNDYRLAAAARHDIGQAEMDTHLFAESTALTPKQQKALFEVHFLAFIIEEILHLMPGDYSNWRETL